jgi:hypothetical protein
MAIIDEISPPYVGEDKLVLSLAEPQVALLAFVPFQVNVDYSKANPLGIKLPLELVFQGPNSRKPERRLFERARPDSLLLVPKTRGQHFILLRELFHNRWQGRLLVDVQGDDLNDGNSRIL